MIPNSRITSFGAWVRALRRQLDLTQAELGKRASCSEATIRKIEADERKPSVQLAELLARALDIPPDDYRRFLGLARGTWLEDGSHKVDYIRPSQNNLPAPLTSMIDRVQDRAAITGLLKKDDIRLVTIIGPPGIGKTRLSIQCGQDLLGDFSDGVWFVDLSEICNRRFFAPAVARVLTGIDLPPSPDIDQLIIGIKNRKLLLILDNFEQIAEGAALEVAQLLKACPKIKLLVTSRMRLNIYGENEYPLPPLTTPPRNIPLSVDDLLRYESIQLFVARVRLHTPRFSITAENSRSINEICAILDGIPLAIELAAATFRHKSLEEIILLLHGHNWTGQIGTPSRDLPQRQRTLEEVIEWSYVLLNDEEKSCYGRLGVFSGWFDAVAASELCQIDPVGMVECLNILTEQSLLFRGIVAGQICWRMLEIVRAHAYSKLLQPDKIELIRARFFIDKVKSLRQGSLLAVQENYINGQLANLHGALAWAITGKQTTLALELIDQIEGYWFSLGYLQEGLEYCRQLLKIADSMDTQDRIRLLQVSSDLGWQQHDFETAQLFLMQQGQLIKAGGFNSGYPLYLNRLGRILIEQGKLVEAKAVLNEALERAFDDETALNPGIPLAQLGEIALFDGELVKAEDLCKKALSRLNTEDVIFLAMVKTDLVEVALANRDPTEAQFWLNEAFTPARSHIRRLIIFLCALSGYLALNAPASAEQAAQFYGAIDKLIEFSGSPLGVFYQAINRQRMQIVRQALSNDAWQATYNEGWNWDKEEAIRNASQVLQRLNGI